jgi:hypothetical protein
MANFTAIAGAGKTLERLLNARFKLDEPVIGASTSAVLVRSDDFSLTANETLILPPALSIFLVRVDLDRTMRAAWSAAGAEDGRSHLPLDLHFLLTAWASNADHEHRILGSAMRALEDMPIVHGPMLDMSAGAMWGPTEALQVVAEEMSTEAVMRTFDSLDTNYRLSVPYVARILRIDGLDDNVETPVLTAISGVTPSAERA